MEQNHANHVKTLRQCVDTCRETLFTHCMTEGGGHTEPLHVQRMMDCIEMCETAIRFITRHSPSHALVCAACAEICTACAESCAALGDGHMDHCAEICRKCAESCERMSKQSRARAA